MVGAEPTEVSWPEAHAVPLDMRFPLLSKTNGAVTLHKQADDSALHGSVNVHIFGSLIFGLTICKFLE